MQLLIVSQYFWPETFIINDLARTLRDQGHTVVVATGKPNYPEGRIAAGYTESGTQHEVFDSSISVYRVPLRPRGPGGALNLLRNYLSFALSGATRFPGLVEDFSPDAILVFAPSPITAAIAAIPLKWLKRAHLAIWIQDLWPESLSATGHVNNPVALSLVRLMVRQIYAAADTLLVQSRAFVGPVTRLARPGKVVYYPNSVRLDTPGDRKPVTLPASLADTLANHFCVVFAGNIGSVQAIPTIVQAAELLRDLADVRIVLIGSGSMSAWVDEQKAIRDLDNLVVFERMPMSSMPSVYELASALLVSLKKDEVLSRTVPSKLQAYLAAGQPIIASLDGEGAELVREARAGITCPAEDASALADSIRTVHRASLEERTAMGDAGKAYFNQHFEMSGQAARLVEILEDRTLSVGAGS